jgi:hypothetical protein
VTLDDTDVIPTADAIPVKPPEPDAVADAGAINFNTSTHVSLNLTSVFPTQNDNNASRF